ncbi:MAG: DUF4058 family protein [Gemmataceae bacterium]|nr:DUF4058 family protein [Gemmataceae bacterium]
MGMIFPGMDPYLEDPLLWPEVHTSLVVYIRDQLQPLLRPRYVAAIETRVYLAGPERDVIPDVRIKRKRPPRGVSGAAVSLADAPDIVRAPGLEISEPYLTILDLQDGQSVLAVLEVVSPTNKYAGPGRESYERKQEEVRRSQAHLIEIDLLRAGPHVLAVPELLARGRAPYDYLVSVNPAWGQREEFQLYRRQLRQRLPRIRVPLGEEDPEVVLDVQAVVNKTYEAGSYDDRVNYKTPCMPLLSQEDQEWSNQLIRQARAQP